MVMMVEGVRVRAKTRVRAFRAALRALAKKEMKSFGREIRERRGKEERRKEERGGEGGGGGGGVGGLLYI